MKFKIMTAEQMKEIDELWIDHEGALTAFGCEAVNAYADGFAKGIMRATAKGCLSGAIVVLGSIVTIKGIKIVAGKVKEYRKDTE